MQADDALCIPDRHVGGGNAATADNGRRRQERGHCGGPGLARTCIRCRTLEGASGLQVGVDILADQHPLKSVAQWPAAALIGCIYTVTPFLDLDAGYQRRLNQSAPDNQYLLGATIRW